MSERAPDPSNVLPVAARGIPASVERFIVHQSYPASCSSAECVCGAHLALVQWADERAVAAAALLRPETGATGEWLKHNPSCAGFVPREGFYADRCDCEKGRALAEPAVVDPQDELETFVRGLLASVEGWVLHDDPPQEMAAWVGRLHNVIAQRDRTLAEPAVVDDAPTEQSYRMMAGLVVRYEARVRELEAEPREEVECPDCHFLFRPPR